LRLILPGSGWRFNKIHALARNARTTGKSMIPTFNQRLKARRKALLLDQAGLAQRGIALYPP
jgi:hypothetical protein